MTPDDPLQLQDEGPSTASASTDRQMALEEPVEEVSAPLQEETEEWRNVRDEMVDTREEVRYNSVGDDGGEKRRLPIQMGFRSDRNHNEPATLIDQPN